MEELLRSNDPVYLSFVCHVLDEEGISFLRLDEHMSALEGSIGAIARRILVPSDELLRAKLALGKAHADLSLHTGRDFDA
jgi:Putative prokaryotic signal transducing protein